MGWQILGLLAIAAWVTVFSLVFFLLMRKLNLLRVPLVHEIMGLDVAEMGSSAQVRSLISDKFEEKYEKTAQDNVFDDL